MAHPDKAQTFPSKKSLIRSWILPCLLASATMICVSITIGWQLSVLGLEGSSPRPSAARSVLFTLDLVAFDPLKNIVTLDWWIIGDDCVAGTIPNPEQCPVVNIFANPTQSLSSSGVTPQPLSDGEVGSQPTFQHNATAFALRGPAVHPAFRTQLDIWPHPSQARVDLVDYPFDKYTATASIFAQTNDTGEAVGAWVYNITGSAFGFATTLGSTGVDANTVTFVNMLFNRALSAKLYVITVIVGMWLVSLVLMTLTIKAAIFRYKIETAVLILPVATMIAFAQLRASMPNAPVGFGTNLDAIGSLPIYVCLVFTTVGSLAYCLAGSPTVPKQSGEHA